MNTMFQKINYTYTCIHTRTHTHTLAYVRNYYHTSVKFAPLTLLCVTLLERPSDYYCLDILVCIRTFSFQNDLRNLLVRDVTRVAGYHDKLYSVKFFAIIEYNAK